MLLVGNKGPYDKFFLIYIYMYKDIICICIFPYSLLTSSKLSAPELLSCYAIGPFSGDLIEGTIQPEPRDCIQVRVQGLGFRAEKNYLNPKCM